MVEEGDCDIGASILMRGCLVGVTDRYLNVFDVDEAGVFQELYGNPVDCDA